MLNQNIHVHCYFSWIYFEWIGGEHELLSGLLVQEEGMSASTVYLIGGKWSLFVDVELV